MMRQLSARPGFTEGLLTVLDGQSKKAPLPMTPALVDELRKRVLGNDWQGLDRFPRLAHARDQPHARHRYQNRSAQRDHQRCRLASSSTSARIRWTRRRLSHSISRRRCPASRPRA
jgi:hypothetical protein